MRATAAVAEVFTSLGALVVFARGSDLHTGAASDVIQGAVYGGTQTALDQMKLGEVRDWHA